MSFKWWFKHRLCQPTKLFKDIKWWFKHRIVEKYHIDLKPGYYDIDTRILYANFGLLKEFVENENPFEVIDWEGTSPEAAAAEKEIKELYNWWIHVFPKRDGWWGNFIKEDTEKLIRLMKIRSFLWT